MDFDTLLDEQYHITIKPQQRDAVLHDKGPVTLMGAPGSGKTMAVALRCVWLVSGRGVSPRNILALTCDKLARDDFTAAFRGAFGEEPLRGLPVCTPVELGGLIMKEYAAATNAAPLRIMESGKRRLLRDIYAARNTGEYLTDNRLDALINAIGAAKHSRSADIQESRFGSVDHFSLILADYNKYMSDNNCGDYDEIQARALAALESSPELLERFRSRFTHIVVDEAQELSALQLDLIKTLAAPAGNLFMAGDTDQCLTLSRSAWPQNMEEFVRACPGAAAYRMDRNYRSTHAIADAASRLMKHNFTRRMAVMNTGNEIGLPVEETLLGDYGLLPGHIVARLKSVQGSSAVLYRAGATAAVIADALDREGIPFRLRTQKPVFFEHWVVQDILAFLALGYNPADMTALRRIYRKCGAYIGTEAIDRAEALLGQGAAAEALDALLMDADLSGGVSARLKRLKNNLAAIPDMAPGKAVWHILDKLEYGIYLKKASGEGIEPGSLLHIAGSFASIAERTDSYAALLDRVTRLDGIIGQAADNSDEQAVTLMPVRAAKGTEYTNVYILDLHEGSFPAFAAVTENDGGERAPMEEERNLLYMAVTRASKYAELIRAKKIGGATAESSRFIREMLPAAPPRRARPARKAAGADGAPLPRAEKKQLPRRPGAQKSAQAAASFAPFALENGVPVTHPAFGPGVVSAFDAQRDIVTIQFDKCGPKKLAAAYSMSSGVIRRAEEEPGCTGPV